jgi:sugar O-acyltransferase (sialic acid O-acetyltransferase NeuD family)
MKNIIIIGADVSGMNIHTIIEDINKKKAQWKIIAYLDEFKKKKEKLFNIPIFSSLKEIISSKKIKPEKTFVISAIGSPKNRCRLMEKAREKGFKIATIIHPTANISKEAMIEDGCIICQFSSVHPFAKIAPFSYIHSNTVIGPKVIVKKGVTINALCAISANITIGEKSYIGVGTKIIQGTKIGKQVTLGAGSIVIKDLPDNVLAVGIPAKIKKTNYGN